MGIFSFFKNKKKKENAIAIIQEGTATERIKSFYEKDSDLLVNFEELESLSEFDESKLVEIKDVGVLARLNCLLPSLAKYSSKNKESTQINSIQPTDKLFKVVLKNGVGLSDSNAVANVKKNISSMPKGGFRQSSSLVEPPKTAVVFNPGTVVMSLTSLVVGLFYLQQVNKRMATLVDVVAKVVDYLDVQYKSQVASLVESVYNASKFQMSSIVNEELRNRELDNLQDLKFKCQDLLNQAENTLALMTTKNITKYKEYIEKLQDIDKWRKNQTILVEMLFQINQLDFTLHLGKKAQDHCFGSFSLHTEKLTNIHERLLLWNSEQMQILKIDAKEGKMEKKGFLPFIFKRLRLNNSKRCYRSIDENDLKLIRDQSEEEKTIDYNKNNLFNEDVQIVVKEGKMFYLSV